MLLLAVRMNVKKMNCTVKIRGTAIAELLICIVDPFARSMTIYAGELRAVPLTVTTETLYPITNDLAGCCGSSSQSQGLLFKSQPVSNGKASIFQLTK